MATVSLRKCKTYDLELVKGNLSLALEDLGGLERYIGKGDKVLLKVNLLMKKRPEEAVTTHPVFVRALTELLQEYGASVIIGDSPGGPFTESGLTGLYEICGYTDLAASTGATLNFNTGTMDVKHHEGKLVKQLTVIEALNGVDKVISVSKMKTHGLTVFTGAVKNMFGIIPGIHKAEYHMKMPNIVNFTDMLVDVCSYANPVLSFMDGIVGMEGAGPSAGDPIEIGAILASDSPYHLDAVAVQLMGIEPGLVPTIERTIERGIVNSDLKDIEYPALNVAGFGKKFAKRPEIGGIGFLEGRVPGFLAKPLENIMKPKPVFNLHTCIKCGECAQSCPAKVIEMKAVGPVVDLTGCIRCFCCQELCPVKAVDIHRNWLLSKIVRL